MYTFASILKLYCIYHFLCFPSFTRWLDIDECRSSSHDCHQNATCANTAGHYDCICKPGFIGNGRNCSGEAIINFTFVKRQQREPHTPPPPTSFILSRKLCDKNKGTLFLPSGETRLVTLRWEGRRDTLHNTLFFGKSGGWANASPASTQDPCSTVVEGSQLFTWRWGTPDKWGNPLR